MSNAGKQQQEELFRTTQERLAPFVTKLVYLRMLAGRSFRMGHEVAALPCAHKQILGIFWGGKPLNGRPMLTSEAAPLIHNNSLAHASHPAVFQGTCSDPPE